MMFAPNIKGTANAVTGGWGNLGGVESVPVGAHGRVESVNLSIPPLSTIMLRWEPRG